MACVSVQEGSQAHHARSLCSGGSVSACHKGPYGKADYNRTWCSDLAELAKGPVSITRCQINVDLSGFKIKPDTIVESELGVVTIRHFSLLAFYRFFYERLVDGQGD
jgi:hypothetical protein